MWQRFTERSRRIIFFAHEEAGRLRKREVDTEHLLFGVIREDDSVAMRILDRIGVNGVQIRNALEQQVATGDESPEPEMQLTRAAKRVVDLSYEEARQLSNNYIGTEHILLGLIREEEGLAGRILAELGVEPASVRREVTALQDSIGGAGQPRKQEPLLQTLSDRRTDPPPANAAIVLKALIEADTAQWRGRSLVTLFDVTPEQIRAVLGTAVRLKALKRQEKFLYFAHPKTLALLFEKPSLRTRISFEAGMAHLAGHAIYLAPADVGLGVRESVADVAGGLSRWVDAIAARTYKHGTVVELAANATVPVINALSDREHPLQAFADLLTIQEAKGKLGNHLKLAYVGDGYNVLHALLLACAKVGVNLTVACPPGYKPALAYIAEAQRIGSGAAGTGARIEIVTDPVMAVKDADIVYTDVWTNMGQEAETAERLKVFAPYQVDTALLAHAKPDAIVLHCLPAHTDEEISTEVMNAHRTIVLDQAENRLHTQKALLALMVGLGSAADNAN